MQAGVRQHEARMIQTPLPPEQEIQIKAARTPWQLLISITAETALQLMQLREQLQRRSLGCRALHSPKKHDGIAVDRLPWRPAYWSRLEQWRPGAGHLSS